MALGKETFADGFFADCSLPSAALGKAFAECNRGFVECPKHSAKSPSAVVTWGSSSFNTRKAYKHILGTLEASPLFPWLWSSGNLGKHKFFFWLLLRDKLNTRNLLRRKDRAIDDYNCVLCNNGVEESAFHLFFECPFSQSCWDSINIHWNTNLQPLDMVIEARTNFGSIILREIMITAY